MADAHFVLAEFVEWFMPRLYEVAEEREVDPADPTRLSQIANGCLCALGGQQGWDSVVYTFVQEEKLIFATYGPADVL